MSTSRNAPAPVTWTRATSILVLAATFLASSAAGAAGAAGVPEFDPLAPVVLDMEGGSERPNAAAVTDAFEQQYGGVDACVSKAKRGKNRQLEGDVEVAVLLNPEGAKPLGVNATLPRGSAGKKGLRQCLRNAVAGANYPAYDGPPVVVEFSFELDPGFEDEQ